MLTQQVAGLKTAAKIVYQDGFAPPANSPAGKASAPGAPAAASGSSAPASSSAPAPGN
jgi:hypothetical protein